MVWSKHLYSLAQIQYNMYNGFVMHANMNNFVVI